jgi:serine/threonine protein kinase
MASIPLKPPKLEGFRFDAYIGGGAFGQVWLATDLALGQPRAIKVLPNPDDPAARVMLVNEARHMASLPRHPNRVLVHSAKNGIANCFVVMEYIDGGTLKAISPMPWETATSHILGVGDGLRDVHAAGLLHRDIKPDNVLINSRTGDAMLADFGITATLHHRGWGGTLGFSAPEMDSTRNPTGVVSAKADVYSLGATFIYLLSGQPPIQPSPILHSALRPVPDRIKLVIAKSMDATETNRFSLDEFMAALRQARWEELTAGLGAPSRPSPHRVRLEVTKFAAPAASPDDFSPIPKPAPGYRAGDRVKFEVTATADGFLTVLADDERDWSIELPCEERPKNDVSANTPTALIYSLTAGSPLRRLFVWTRHRIDISAAEWRKLIEEKARHRRQPTRGGALVSLATGDLPIGDMILNAVSIAVI